MSTQRRNPPFPPSPPRPAPAVAAGALCAALLAAGAAAAPQIRFTQAVSLPNIGLRLHVMPDAAEAPLPPPTVYPYVRTDGVSTQRLEMSAPYDLWRLSQQAAQWIDESGNALVLAVITQPLPDGFARPHVTAEEYAAQVAATPGRPTGRWDTGDLSRWAADFTRSRTAKPEVAAQRPPRLRDLVTFALDPTNRWRAAYAFRLAPDGAGQSGATQSWFFALIECDRGIPPEKAQRALRQEFLPYLSGVPRVEARLRTSTPAAQFRSLNRARAGPDSPEFIASRKLVAESIANMQGWWSVETRNYIILSDLGAQNRRLVKKLQENIEVLRSAFEQMIPARVPIRAVSVIRALASSAEYSAYVGPDLQWSFGLWMPAKKELVIRPVESRDRHDADEHLTRSIYHEACHQYLFYAMDQLTPAPWFNEGHAGLFETAEIRAGSGQTTLNEDALKLPVVQRIVRDDNVQLRRLLALSLPEFYARDERIRAGNYALAWALVYYLRQAPVPEKPAAYGRILDRYLEALWQTRDPEAATKAAFDKIDIKRLETDFAQFWTSDRKRAAARRRNQL